MVCCGLAPESCPVVANALLRQYVSRELASEDESNQKRFRCYRRFCTDGMVHR